MKNLKYKAIIFDMDGTITDTESLWKRATLTIIERRGISVSPADQDRFHKQLSGMSLHEACARIKAVFNLPDSHENIMKEKADIAHELFEQEVRLFEGFIKFHADIKERKLKIAIATNADDKSLAIAKRILDLEDYFDEHIYNISHVDNQAKPHPALYLYAAEQLGVDPEDCIAIEDSPHGIRAAKDAGMFCIGYNSSRDKNQVKEADLIVDEYHHIDLEKLLK
jgi:HAD superfamily hydrolase (TIGR01509 family)